MPLERNAHNARPHRTSFRRDIDVWRNVRRLPRTMIEHDPIRSDPLRIEANEYGRLFAASAGALVLFFVRIRQQPPSRISNS